MRKYQQKPCRYVCQEGEFAEISSLHLNCDNAMVDVCQSDCVCASLKILGQRISYNSDKNCSSFDW